VKRLQMRIAKAMRENLNTYVRVLTIAGLHFNVSSL